MIGWRRSTAWVAVLVLAAAPALTVQSLRAQEAGVVTGLVTDAESREPIAEAVITVFSGSFHLRS